MRRTTQLVMLATLTAAALALVPASALAQHRGGSGGGGGQSAAGHPSGGGGGGTAVVRPSGGHGYPGGGRTTVIVSRPYSGYYGAYWGYPYWGWGWGWNWGWPYWYGSPYGPYSPYWGGRGYDNSAEIRLDVKPKEAEVYVDGYYAGIVDDFNGVFQRLRVRPGNHELVLYLKGYRSVKQDIHLGSNQDSKIKYQMEPLAAGEANEPAPQPRPEALQAPANPPDDEDRPAPPRRPLAPRAPQPPPPSMAAEVSQGFGSLVIRVQPAGADVLIDGERWQGPDGSERLVVQVSEGSHRIEVRKDGFTPFATTIRVRQGETAPLNVSLPPRGE